VDRQTALSAGTALVGVLALALAAATLSTTVERRGGARDVDSGGSTEGWWLLLPDLPLGERARGLLLVALLVTLLVVAALFLYGSSRARRGRRLDFDVEVDYRKRGLQLLALLVVAGLLVLFLFAVLTGALAPGFSQPGADPRGPGGSGEAGRGPVFSPAVLVVVLLVLVLGVVTALVSRFRGRGGSRSSGESTSPADEDPDQDPDPATVARAAGEAADRIEDGRTVENEVYRAWREMTELLALSSPGTRTPGEFAAAAVDAGIAPDDVAELTRLFEDVRYGDDEPTPETERRARAVFRRIESAYGDESS
jgi:hypothetical protein